MEHTKCVVLVIVNVYLKKKRKSFLPGQKYAFYSGIQFSENFNFFPGIPLGAPFL
jgi:hypothetical protein